MAIANSIRASIETNMEFNQSLRVDTWPRSNDLQFTEMMRVTKEWILRDIIGEKLKKVSLATAFLFFQAVILKRIVIS